MEKKENTENNLFEAENAEKNKNDKSEERKKFLNSNLLENPDELKRKRDEAADLMRRRDRENRIKKKRMGYDEDFMIVDEGDLPEKPKTEVKEEKKEMQKDLQTFMQVIEQLPNILMNLKNTDHEKCLNALTKLRKLLSARGYTPIQEVIDAGVLPVLIDYAAQDSDPGIQVLFIFS